MMQSRWKALLIPVGIAAIMTPAIVLAAGGSSEEGFDAIVHGIETQYHAHATRIPFLGLISGLAGISTHGGVRNLHLAEFDDVHGSQTGGVNGDELNALVQAHVGQGWQRIVRETSREGDEQNLLYVHPEGNRLGMLVVDLEGHELSLVQISINPDQLTRELRDRHERHHRHDADSDADKHDSDGKPDAKPEETKPDEPKSEQ